MSNPFEDPRKRDLRERAAVAIEGSGHALVDPPTPVALPAGSDLKGEILGDIQSRDSKDALHVYFVRTNATKPIPGWIQKLAQASHQIAGLRVHVVVEEVSSVLEKSCKSCGAGLLLVRATYELEVIVDPDDFSPAAVEAAFKERASALRSQLLTSRDWYLNAARDQFAKVAEATDGMPDHVADQWIARAENRGEILRDWADRLGAMLDEAEANRDPTQLEAIKHLIDEGP